MAGGGVWFSSWCVVSIDTGHIAQSPQSGPRWSPAFKIEPVLFPPSVQGLRLHDPSARGPDSIPGQATRSRML